MTSTSSTARHVSGIGAEVMDIFMSHTWPGNIRELRNILERASIMCERELITRSCLPEEFGRSAGQRPQRSFQHQVSHRHYRGCDGARADPANAGATGNNKTRAAELLAISLKTLHNKLKEYGADRAGAE